jgi:hypothetical protein
MAVQQPPKAVRGRTASNLVDTDDSGLVRHCNPLNEADRSAWAVRRRESCAVFRLAKAQAGPKSPVQTEYRFPRTIWDPMLFWIVSVQAAPLTAPWHRNN